MTDTNNAHDFYRSREGVLSDSPGRFCLDGIVLRKKSKSLKHLPGQHNQMTYAHGGGGGDAGSGGSGFNADEWKQKDDPRGEWEAMPVRQRDKLADATNSVGARQAEHLKGLPDRPDTGDLGRDVETRVGQMKDRVAAEERELIANVGKSYSETLQKAGVSEQDARKLTMEAVDSLAAQDIESYGRTLGDHGIRHIEGNIRISQEILNSRPSGRSEKENAIAITAMIFHDTGYLTPPSQNFLDEGHPRWSAEHFDANIAPTVTRALGVRASGEVGHIIRTHDASTLDWTNDPVASACRVSDNMALFSKEKLPPVFKQVPDNLQVLKDVSAKKISVEEGRSRMKKNISDSDLPDKIKSRLTRAADETNKYTGKFTLGMLGGEISSVGWKGDHVSVKLRESKQVSELNKLGDFGQGQFSKWAKTYGIDPAKFKSNLNFELRDSRGRVLLETVVEAAKRLAEAIRKKWSQ